MFNIFILYTYRGISYLDDFIYTHMSMINVFIFIYALIEIFRLRVSICMEIIPCLMIYKILTFLNMYSI